MSGIVLVSGDNSSKSPISWRNHSSRERQSNSKFLYSEMVGMLRRK